MLIPSPLLVPRGFDLHHILVFDHEANTIGLSKENEIEASQIFNLCFRGFALELG